MPNLALSRRGFKTHSYAFIDPARLSGLWNSQEIVNVTEPVQALRRDFPLALVPTNVALRIKASYKSYKQTFRPS